MDCPTQYSGGASKPKGKGVLTGAFDMRDHLNPRRLTMIMWDNAFLLRHGKGGSFENYEKVLAETEERGYNTVRLDPMPQWVDLKNPEQELHWVDPKIPYMPWNWNTAVDAPIGSWLIDFMTELKKTNLYYTLSAWWFSDETRSPKCKRIPSTHVEAAEIWLELLTDWKARFGFENLLYVDLANEVPYFLAGFIAKYEKDTGSPWYLNNPFSKVEVDYLAHDLNNAMGMLQREFPELRFTASIHGDVRWVDIPLDFDCLDVHFYADADTRWSRRTEFIGLMSKFYTENDWHSDFSERCMKTSQAIAPMLRARQRHKLAQFAQWANERGMPLTTTESWSSWYYFDSPNLDWGWLLDWAEWSVEDALEFNMWGWTPHNYCQPQFENWKDIRWHRRLTDKFLRG